MTAKTQPSALSSQPSKKGWINTFYRHHNGKKLGPSLSCSPTVALAPQHFVAAGEAMSAITANLKAL